MATSNGSAPAAGLLGGKKILSGTKKFTGVNFNDRWGDLYFAEVLTGISFGSAFSSPPTVVVSLSISGSSSGMVSYINYDINELYSIGVIRATEAQNTSIIVNWVAIGS